MTKLEEIRQKRNEGCTCELLVHMVTKDITVIACKFPKENTSGLDPRLATDVKRFDFTAAEINEIGEKTFNEACGR
jgi:hypothetical protein